MGVDQGLTLYALYPDFGAALVNGVVLYGLHRAGDGLGVGDVLHGGDGQQGDDLLDIENITDHQTVDVDAGVEGLQLTDGHIVGKGDAVEGVAGLHGVGGLAGLVGGEGLTHFVHGHQIGIGIDVLHPDGVHKLGGNGIFVDILGLQILQHGIQRGPILDGAHGGAVDDHLILPQLRADLIQLFVEVGLHGGLIVQIAFQGEGKLIFDVIVQRKRLTQHSAAPVFHLTHGAFYHGLTLHDTHGLAVHHDQVAAAGVHAGGGEGGEGQCQTPGGGDRQEGNGAVGGMLGRHIVDAVEQTAGVDVEPVPQVLQALDSLSGQLFPGLACLLLYGGLWNAV